jgi:N-formylglutamate deformylase
MTSDPSQVLTLHRGTTPLVVSLPHVGTYVPPELLARMHPRAAEVEDTDWHLERLYDFVRDLGATLLVPRASRFVVDLNRPPENAPMYAGRNNTELCPTHFFTGEPLYREGQAPGEAEARARVATWWQPYHDTLRAELARAKAAHGHAVLFDGHSIKSELPWLFDGRVWDLNLGTVDGASCAPTLRAALVAVLEGQARYSQVADGRFKGGHITRHYGRPAEGIHTIQLEMCWRCYMHESPPYAYDEARAAEVTPLLRQLIETMRDWRPA